MFFQGNDKTYRLIGGSYFSPGSGGGALGNIYTNYTDRWTVDNPRQDVFWPRLSIHQMPIMTKPPPGGLEI